MAKLLESIRVLDLTDHKGFFCGKILADLGADVIKVEKPGGDLDRYFGPFYHDIQDPEKSLNWFAYNLNKRSITLNIETRGGKELFRRLAECSDVIIESYPPGYMEVIESSYKDMSRINPRIIMTSISPFGQSGPYRDFKGSDLVCMAMGGLAYITGSIENSPVRVSFPQSYLLASAEAAATTVIAYYHRERTGKGQHIDVSIQASIAGKLANAIPTWELNHTILKREGSYMFGRGAKLKMRLLWRCKDGYVTFALMGGKLGAKSNQKIANWIIEEGSAPEFFKNVDWASLDMAKQSQEDQERLEGVVSQFFSRYTKAELYQRANEDGVLLCPQSSLKDITENVQLKERRFWGPVEHPELDEKILYPGPFLKASVTPLTLKRRAPLIGEHNEEIFNGLLGLTMDEIGMKQLDGII
ncbi:MAG: CoA transferase [Deltaproteobacteria bacterium]|nr:CoA transferase [Deltaproteobacteria bacterium]